ncbi:zinc ABC transporter substrate-binding protein [Corynebacterium simulans]|uniref:ABC transporter substrate-binding protein n=1 Tax=Corynebacterium striatum TaxID=43770 RepID=A0ABC8CJA3_CORST|nr:MULTISPECIES: zinc ABC transporter substrate-binding protein [Corynebacterium]ATZ08667.1 ABC transporter substrate-binding protein [Corynebacterium striatum]EGT5590666.1 ABC transporter substrate-binding protein [Corynebacterium striatum]EGT5595408.1 ABC transporter substrate-binding protein [Corynebacterium striatum]EGT5611289.1 ABC transporter substrate-binding protein [Corynebacterium striatum]MDK7138786.1 zinc ABC transporter substrate-binding protein [Corynebacterium simulans]
MSFSLKSLAAPAALLCAGSLTLAGCSSTDSADEDTIKVVASTSIWADVAQEVIDSAQGQDVKIEVEPIVKGNGIDPHHFEPTAADIAKANEADVLIVGGGGYDSWLYQAVKNQDEIIHALPLTDHGKLDEQPDVVTAAEAKDIAKKEPSKVTNIEGNEHVWYDAAAIEKVATEVADLVNEENPEAKASADPLLERVEDIKERVEKLPKLNYAQTEPIADYIMKYTPALDVTPEGFRKATVSEGEPTAADLARFLQTVKDGKVDLLIYNPQTETDISSRIHKAAEERHIPIVEIGETPPEGTNFLDYYEQAVDHIEAA